MKSRRTKDDISVIILFFHIKKHEKTHLGLLESSSDEEERALSDDDDMINEAKQNRSADTYHVTRSLSDVNMSVYGSRQSHRDVTKTVLREIFSGDSLPPIGSELLSFQNGVSVSQS